MFIADFLELRDHLLKDVGGFARILAIQVSRCTPRRAMNESECSFGPLQPVRRASFCFEKRTPNNDRHGLQRSAEKFQILYIDGAGHGPSLDTRQTTTNGTGFEFPRLMGLRHANETRRTRCPGRTRRNPATRGSGG